MLGGFKAVMNKNRFLAVLSVTISGRDKNVSMEAGIKGKKFWIFLLFGWPVFFGLQHHKGGLRCGPTGTVKTTYQLTKRPR
jgi:hypothetical protein